MSASSLRLLCTNSTGVIWLPAEHRRAMSYLTISLWGQSHTTECWRGALDSRMVDEWCQGLLSRVMEEEKTKS